MDLFEEKEWKNRQTEYPSRRQMVHENGDVELVTITRAEGTIVREGDPFSAENMNDLENRIKNAIGEGQIPEELGADILEAIDTINTRLGGVTIKIVQELPADAAQHPDTLYLVTG